MMWAAEVRALVVCVCLINNKHAVTVQLKEEAVLGNISDSDMGGEECLPSQQLEPGWAYG